MAQENFCKNIFSDTIAASGTGYGETLEMQRKEGFDGFFCVQPVFTGTGTLAISYQLSNDGSTWSPAVSITASATSGTVYPYPEAGTSIFAGFQRLVFTETGGANQVVITSAIRCAQ